MLRIGDYVKHKSTLQASHAHVYLVIATSRVIGDGRRLQLSTGNGKSVGAKENKYVKVGELTLEEMLTHPDRNVRRYGNEKLRKS